jgi:hypothetical protein
MSKPANPFRRAESSEVEYQMQVYVDDMGESSGVGGGVANTLSGYAVFQGEKFPFEAIAYGRIGGQNVSPTLTEESSKRLQDLSVDVESFTSQLQRKLVEGEINVVIPEGTPPPGMEPTDS